MAERRRDRASLLEVHVRPHSFLQFVQRATGGHQYSVKRFEEVHRGPMH